MSVGWGWLAVVDDAAPSVSTPPEAEADAVDIAATVGMSIAPLAALAVPAAVAEMSENDDG